MKKNIKEKIKKIFDEIYFIFFEILLRIVLISATFYIIIYVYENYLK